MRIGYEDADRLISYPDPHNLSIWRQPIRMRSRRRHRWTILEGNALGRAWLRCPWAAAGPGRASSQHTEPCISTAGAAGVEGAGGSGGHGRASRRRITTQHRRRRRCGGRRRVRRARAGFEIDHSEPQARVWRSRGRPGPTAPGTPAAPQATKTPEPHWVPGLAAEDGGFEPPRACTQHAFQACAIGH